MVDIRRIHLFRFNNQLRFIKNICDEKKLMEKSNPFVQVSHCWVVSNENIFLISIFFSQLSFSSDSNYVFGWTQLDNPDLMTPRGGTSQVQMLT